MIRPHPNVRPAARLGAALVASCLLSGIVPASSVAAACWFAPVDAPISDPYRPPRCPWCAGNRGIEYATVPGTPVRAVASGTVTFAGTVVDRRYVVVEHADGRRATYGLLSSIGVSAGDRVTARSIVGTAGATTHFGLRDGDDYVDPTPEIGRLAYAVRLVPLDGSPGAPPGPARPRCETPEIRAFPGANHGRGR
ncbi:peptidase M23-like protein [Ilumatobacter fluminis]|uniref:Peptidase M23-like protein n=1 Tax=Ilumatobacter fluminis TaxID=467091 RepID=A0A4R7I2Y5_9ACTN|nr:M23 family metallopeptidase [Ilumatobacter fluminis]TDT17006.1 peptidase M23-like protein [Ilumatobacter fluminis]